MLNVSGQRADTGIFMVANATLSLVEAQTLANTINALLGEHSVKLSATAKR